MRLLRMMGFGPQIVFGGDSGGGGGGGGNDDNDSSPTTTTASRSQADVQAEINAALDASGGAWTSELNGLVAERNDIVDSGGGGGGTSNADAMREYASSMTAAGQTSLSGANPTTVAPASNISDYEREAFGTDQATFYNNQTDDTPAAETNAERVVREAVSNLVDSGTITQTQADNADTQGAVNLLNNTGVPTSDVNPLGSDTMGIGSDGNLVDAVTGATDAGALINTIGTPTVETPTVTPVVRTSTNPRIGYESGQDVLSSSPAYLTGADGSGPNTVGQVDDAFYGGPGAAVNPGAAIATAQRDATDSGLLSLAKIGGANFLSSLGGFGEAASNFVNPPEQYTFGYGTGVPQLDSNMNVIGEVDPGFAKYLGADPNLVANVPGSGDNKFKTGAQNLQAYGQNLVPKIKSTMDPTTKNILEGNIVTKDPDKAFYDPSAYELGETPVKTLLANIVTTLPSLIPTLAVAAGTRNPTATLATASPLVIGEISNDAQRNLQEQYDSGALGPISEAQLETMKSNASSGSVIPGATLGVLEAMLLRGVSKGTLTKILTGSAGTGAAELAEIQAAKALASDIMSEGAATADANQFAVTSSDLTEVRTAVGVGGAGNIIAGGGPKTDTSSDSGISTVGTSPIVQPSGGTGGTGLTSAQRTALSDTTGIAGAGTVAPTVSTVAPAQPGTSVDAANTMAVDPFFSEGVVLDPQNVVTPPVAPTQPSTNQDVIDAVFTDIVPPNVTTTAPAQIAAPDASVASGVISGTPTTTTAPTTQVVPQLPAPAAVDTTPFVDISAIAPPNVTTNIDQITIPGTNITVDVPSLQTPTTDSAVNTAQPSGLASLGTGGAFNPNVSNLPASVTASPIAQPVTETAATDAVSQDVLRARDIEQASLELAQGGVDASLAQASLQQQFNLTPQEAAKQVSIGRQLNRDNPDGNIVVADFVRDNPFSGAIVASQPNLIDTISTGVPQFQMDGTAPAGINTSTVTQEAVDFVNSGSTSQSDLLRIARENGIVSGPGTGTMPAQIIAELRDRVSNPNFKVVPKSDASTTSLVPVGGPGTNVVPSNTANTGIATLDPNKTDVGGLEGEILGPDNAVVQRDTGPAIEGPTIEGTTNSLEVDAAQTVATEPFINEGVIVDPEISTEVNIPVDKNVTIDGTINPNAVVPINPNAVATTVEVDSKTDSKKTVIPPKDVQILPVNIVTDDDNDDDITVEVDEPVVVDEDVVVEIDPPIDFDDDDDVAVEEDAPFECPDGFEAVQVNGVWRCQSTDDMPEKVRPTAGAYYRPNPNPNYGAAARRRRA